MFFSLNPSHHCRASTVTLPGPMPTGANTGSGEVEPEALASGGLLWTRVSTVLRFAVGGLIKMEQRSCTAAKQFQFAAPFVAKGLTKAEYYILLLSALGSTMFALHSALTGGIDHGS